MRSSRPGKTLARPIATNRAADFHRQRPPGVDLDMRGGAFQALRRDAKHKLIVEQQVTNQGVDMGLLTQTAEPAR
jgi:hypothetical protein